MYLSKNILTINNKKEENYREVSRLKSEREKALDEAEALGKKVERLEEALGYKEEETVELSKEVFDAEV